MAETHTTVSEEVALSHARGVVDAIKDVINPLLAEHAEALEEDGVAAFLTALHNLPAVPLAAEARAMIGNDAVVANLELFPTMGSREQDLHEIWGVATHAIGILAERRHVAGRIELGTPASEQFFARVLPAVANGRYQTVADKIERGSDSYHEKQFFRLLTPVALLQCAFAAANEDIELNLAPAERLLPRTERDNLIIERLDPIITEACRAIVAGEPLPSRNKADSAPRQIVAGALEALSRAYRIGESQTDIEKIVLPLVMLRLQWIIDSRLAQGRSESDLADTISGILKGTNTTFDMGKQLDRAAIRVQRELAAAGLDVTTEQVRAMEPPANRTLADYQRIMTEGANTAHELLRIRALAHAMVDGIAGGQFTYGQIQQIASQLHESPLGDNADYVEKQQALAAAEQAAAARAQEAAILERINSAVNLLQWEVLPAGNSDDNEPRAARTPDGETAPHEHTERRLEPQRFAVLLELQEGWPYPGAKIYRSRLDSPEGRRREGEEYYVLVLPQVMPDGQIVVHAVAECAANDNALYMIRGDMYDDIDWNDVFSQNKGYAQAKGAIWLRHAPQKQYDEDPIGTMNRFTDRVYEHLAMPIEEFWGKWMGQTAVRATVNKAEPAPEDH